MSSMLCDIVTPESLLFSEDVYFVSVPGKEGEMGFLPLHAPIMSTLRLGLVRVKKEDNGEAIAFAVDGGYVESDGRKIVVLADRAEAVGKLSLDKVLEAKADNQRKLDSLTTDDSRAAFYNDEIAWFSLLEAQLKQGS